MELIREIDNSTKITSYKDVVNYLDEFKNQDREMLIVLGLDTRNKPVYREIVSVGTLNSTLIHPREVFKKAIIMSCNSIVVAHNHPSGDPEPSDDDKEITRQLKQAGEILDIKLLDHVIIGKDEPFSFNEEHFLN